MKKIKLTIIVFFILSFTNFVKADLNIPLKKYLDGKDIEKGSTQIYLLKRCSSVYAYASGVILKLDAVNSKNFIEWFNKKVMFVLFAKFYLFFLIDLLLIK